MPFLASPRGIGKPYSGSLEDSPCTLLTLLEPFTLGFDTLLEALQTPLKMDGGILTL